MAENVKLIDPEKIDRNPDNPRLIFHQEELDALRDSIELQGILVPLTIYQDQDNYFLLDGERRWRCSLKIGLPVVPVIVQPKPDPLQNLMMMFAIHHRRDEWDPLPTALKLQELENLYTTKQEKAPTETQLAELASLTRGEVRRLKSLLQLPQHYRDELMEELQKPRSKQVLTVDHILETVKGVAGLRKRNIVENEEEEENLRRAIISKFRNKKITNTVAPRKLLRLARGVERGEIKKSEAQKIVRKLTDDAEYTIDMAFNESVEDVDFQHNFNNLLGRVRGWVNTLQSRETKPSSDVLESLEELRRQIDSILKK